MNEPIDINEMCCEPDHRDGHYVHAKGCWGSVEANLDRDEELKEAGVSE